jgi:hypothetical protein
LLALTRDLDALATQRGSRGPKVVAFPSIFRLGTVPAMTSAAEITCEVSDNFCEKFNNIDFASPVGTKRFPICTP